jgi:3-hydroxy acid dehydrogenase / malonic semialdehyde reductase
MTRIEGKRVLITGASSGIGAACARRFAREGADVILWARRLERLEQLARELGSANSGRIDLHAVDVRDRAAVSDAATALIESGTAPHVLVNNAGLAAGFDFVQDGDPDDWDRMIDTNVKGLLNVTRALLPAMIRLGRGHIINIGSTAGHMAYPRGNVYAATKHAVRALTEGMNLDVQGTPIRVSSVDPGFVETEFSVVRFACEAGV